jgi:hypothetical protein
MPEPLVIPIKIDAKGIEQELKNITEKLTFDFNLKVSGKGGGSKTADYVSQETTEKENIKIGKEQLKNQEKEGKNREKEIKQKDKEEKKREKENKQKEKEENKRHKETLSIFKSVASGLGIGLGVSAVVGTARKIATESYEYGKTFANFATATGISATELTNATKLFAGLGASEQEQLAMANYVLSAQQAYALRGEGPLKTNLYGRYSGLSSGLENLSLPDYIKEMNRYFQENLQNATPAQQREFLSSAFGSETAFGMELLKKPMDELKETMLGLATQTERAKEGIRLFSSDWGSFIHNLKTGISNDFFGRYAEERKSGEGFISSLALASGSIINDFVVERFQKTFGKSHESVFNKEENKDVYDVYDGLNYTPFNTEENKDVYDVYDGLNYTSFNTEENESLKQSSYELKKAMSELKSQTDDAADGARSFSKDFGKFCHNLKTDISNIFFEWHRLARQKDLSIPISTVFDTNDTISKSGSKRELSIVEYPSKNKKIKNDVYDGLNYTPFNTEENEPTFSSIGKEFLENQQTPIYDMISGSQTSIDASQNMTVIVNGNMTEDMLERTATEVGGMSYPNMSYFSGGVLK